MTDHPLPGKTEWETQQYRADRGHHVAAAQAYAYLGRRLETDPAFPLPDGAEAVIAQAAAAMQAVAAAREADSEAYATGRRAALLDALAEDRAAKAARKAVLA
jgi:hypothetical protein